MAPRRFSSSQRAALYPERAAAAIRRNVLRVVVQALTEEGVRP